MTRNHRSLRHAALLVLTPALAVGAAQLGSSAVAKPAKLPDLKVSSVVAPTGELAPGDRIAVTTVVANAGRAKAKTAKVRYYLSTDKAAGKDVKLSASGKVSALAPGKKATVKTGVVVPASTTDGSYYVLACADGKGKDKSKRNDCRASSTRSAIRAPWKGTLTGTLTYDKASETTSGDTTESSKDHATVDVNINIDESKSGWGVFGNVGSTYSYNGTYNKHIGDTVCATDIQGTSTGGGKLVQVGNQYEDDIMGDFGALDHSEFDLLLSLDYQRTVTTKRTSVSGLGCLAPGTTVDGPKPSSNLTEVEFHRVAQSGKSVTYEIAEVLGPYSAKTDWQTVTGKLTLQLK